MNPFVLAALIATQAGPDQPPVIPAGNAQPAQSQTQQPPEQQTPEEREQAKHQKEVDDDIRLGKEYAIEVDKELKPSEDQAMIDRVNRIGKELAEIANKTHVKPLWGDNRLSVLPYQFKVVKGKDINAFSLPGGTIYVYEGLLKYVESDDELAGVLAHEIAHASLRHIATLRRESSKLDTVTIPLVLVGILTGNVALVTGSSLAAQAMGSGWSVKAEQSADNGGVDYLLKSPYNPVGVLTFMERLAYDDRYKANWDYGIYRTHPPSRERADALRNQLSAAGVTIRRSKVCATLATQISEQADHSYAISFLGIKLFTFYGPNAKDRAVVSAEQLNAFFDSQPKVHDVRAYGGDSVEGKGEPLIQITEDDAERAGKSLSQLTSDTTEAVKHATYDLGYRVWDFAPN